MNNIERMHIDSDLLATFLVIAECRNLTLAAGRLSRTQSAISVKLRKLETALGVRLFERTPKGMVLTTAGETLLPQARLVEDSIGRVKALFRSPLKGTIRIGIPDDFDADVLENALSNFARAHPDVQVTTRSGCTADYPNAIDKGELDIAVCSGPENQRGIFLGQEKTVWAAKKGLRIDPAQPVPVALLDRSCWWRRLPTDALANAGRNYTIAFCSSSFASILAAIRSGLAIGAVPQNALCVATVGLSERDGLPKLPASYRYILTAKATPEPLAEAMIDAIKNARHALG
ncbi:MAG: LysR family transcriptional regulator [Pseudomonadota bacterium]